MQGSSIIDSQNFNPGISDVARGSRRTDRLRMSLTLKRSSRVATLSWLRSTLLEWNLRFSSGRFSSKVLIASNVWIASPPQPGQRAVPIEITGRYSNKLTNIRRNTVLSRHGSLSGPLLRPSRSPFFSRRGGTPDRATQPFKVRAFAFETLEQHSIVVMKKKCSTVSW